MNVGTHGRPAAAGFVHPGSAELARRIRVQPRLDELDRIPHLVQSDSISASEPRVLSADHVLKLVPDHALGQRISCALLPEELELDEHALAEVSCADAWRIEG